MSKKDELSTAIGLRLRAERHLRELSLSQLAALTGNKLSKSRISNYEQGLRRMGLEESMILGRALGDVSPVYLLCLDDSDPLSSAERELLKLFRESNARGRTTLLSLVKAEAIQTHDKAAALAG